MVNNNPRFNNAFTTAKQFFVNKDTNKDTALNTTEIFGATPTAENINLVKYMDFDNNGSLSLAEFTLAIQSVDTNGDGQLASTELAALSGKANQLAAGNKNNDFSYQLLALQLGNTQALVQQQTPIIPVSSNITPPTLSASDKAAVDAALLVSKSDFGVKDANQDKMLTLTEAFGANPTAAQQSLYSAINIDKTQGVDLAELTYANALFKALGAEGAVAKLTGTDAAANLAILRSYVGSTAPTPPVTPPAPALTAVQQQRLDTAYTSATETFKTRDTNQDKALTSIEAFGVQANAEQQRLFPALDLNNDSKLSKAELVWGEFGAAEVGLPTLLAALTDAKNNPQSAIAQTIASRFNQVQTFVTAKDAAMPPPVALNLNDNDKAALMAALAIAKQDFAARDANDDKMLSINEAFGASPTAEQQRLYNAINVDKGQGVDIAELTFANALAKALGTEGAIAVLSNPVAASRLAQVKVYVDTLPA
jgi:hypothetical protein